MDIQDNTVSAFNQMVNSSELSFLGNENAKTKILVVGNSITRHGPLAEIGWNNDWGMAASAPEKDYVHRLYSKLVDNGQDVYMRIRQCAFWEVNFLKEDILSYYMEERVFDADIVIVRLGENVPEVNRVHFQAALKKFIEHICPTGKAIYVTCFWPEKVVDGGFANLAKERAEICLDGFLSKDESNMAIGLFEHAGVAGHPSDKGMEAIADLIFSALKK